MMDMRVYNKRLASGVDRLSDLPDDILMKILSLLPIQQVAQTHGLSKRWKFLWSFRTHLSFSIGLRKDLFSANFVRNLIANYKGPKVKSFLLEIEKDVVDAAQIDEWVRFAVDRCVNSLLLNLLNPKKRYKVPRELFGSGFLKFLDLKSCLLRVPSTVCLPSLKEVTLKEVRFTRCSLKKLTSGSPVLKKLVLDTCNEDCDLCVDILNPSVEVVCVIDGPSDQYSTVLGVFKINAPSILFLSLQGRTRQKYLLKNVASLIEADIDFNLSNGGHIATLKRLIGSLSCMNLQLGGWCIQVLSMTCIMNKFISPLNSVAWLHLRIPLLRCELPGVSRLVEVFPNLEALTLSFGFWDNGFEETWDHWISYDGLDISSYIIPPFLLVSVFDETSEKAVERRCWEKLELAFSHKFYNLKTVEVENFYGLGLLASAHSRCAEEPYTTLCQRQLKLIKLLLKHSPMLEEMNISFPKCKVPRFADADAKLRKSISNKVLTCPKASPSAEIFFW